MVRAWLLAADSRSVSFATRRRAAFTLIELLVVVVILGVLIGLLLPSLRGAREAARTVKCLSNQRQIGTALAMYAETFREYIPRESGFAEPIATPTQWLYPAWPFVLRPFLDTRASIIPPDQDPSGGVGDRYARAAYYHDPARKPDGHNIHYVNNGLSFSAPGVVNETAKRPTPMNRYAKPYDTLYLTDFADDTTRVHYTGWYTSSATDWSIAFVYDMHEAANVVGGVSSATGSQRVAPARHGLGKRGGGANGVFLDGHAQTISSKVITTLARWDDGDYRPDGPPKVPAEFRWPR